MQRIDFSSARVLVIGDVMLDRYWWGNVDRISPEAPVPVVKLIDKSLAAGGAANVAVNVAGLGAVPVLCGIVGDDDESKMLAEILRSSRVSVDHLFAIEGRSTTVKTRVIAHSQQVARIDQETEALLEKATESMLIEKVVTLVGSVNAVVMSDYAKGFLTDNIISAVIRKCKDAQIPVFVDPKGKSYDKYRGASMITPNRREAAEACNLADGSGRLIEQAGNRLINELGVDSVLITQGEEGMTLFRHQVPPKHFHASARKVFDVTGAGDTVIATIAAAAGSGADLESSIFMANVAAGLVVEQVGTSSISSQALGEALAEKNQRYENS